MGTRKNNFKFALGAISEVGGKFVSEIQLFKLGEFEHWSGKSFVVDDAFMDSMIKNFGQLQARSKDSHVVVVDYNHGTEYGDTNPEAQKAAGWMTQLTKRADGLYATVEWTPTAAGYIKNGEYKYISPTFLPEGANDEYGNNIEGAFLYSAALLNTPFFKGMEPVAMAAKDKKENQMDIDKLRKILGMSDKAEEKELIAAIEGASNEVSELRLTLGLKEGGELLAGVKALLAERDSFKAEALKSSEEVAKLTAAHHESEAKAKVEKLIAEDKLDPKFREKFVALAKEAPTHFDSITKDLSPKGRFEVIGSGSTVTEEVGSFDDEVKKIMTRDKVGYLVASRTLQKENPELARKQADRTGKKTTVN